MPISPAFSVLDPFTSVGLKNLRKTCNVETQSSKPAAGGRRVSRRREEDAKSDKRWHRVNLPFLLLAETIWDITRFAHRFIEPMLT